MSTPPDVPQSTIEAARGGSVEALDSIFRTYHPLLIRYLRVRAGDLADDVASQTWISVAESIGRFSGDSRALRGWIVTIGRRRLVDELRRRNRLTRQDQRADSPEVDLETPEEVALSGVGRAQQLLSHLPARQADVIMLRVIGGLSVEDVATATGLSPGNVRVLCHRGLARLQHLLENEPPV